VQVHECSTFETVEEVVTQTEVEVVKLCLGESSALEEDCSLTYSFAGNEVNGGPVEEGSCKRALKVMGKTLEMGTMLESTLPKTIAAAEQRGISVHNCMAAMESRVLCGAPGVGNEGHEVEPGNEPVGNENECGRIQP